jgi:hypothetical protein
MVYNPPRILSAMRPIVLLSLILLAGCARKDVIVAEVEIVGAMPPVAGREAQVTVLYQVVEPEHLEFKYGLEPAARPAPQVDALKGKRFKIERPRSWRNHLLPERPARGSATGGPDFFAGAVAK